MLRDLCGAPNCAAKWKSTFQRATSVAIAVKNTLKYMMLTDIWILLYRSQYQ